MWVSRTPALWLFLKATATTHVGLSQWLLTQDGVQPRTASKPERLCKFGGALHHPVKAPTSEPQSQSLQGRGELSWTEGLAGQHTIGCILLAQQMLPQLSLLPPEHCWGRQDVLTFSWAQSHSQPGMPPFWFHPNIAAQDSQSLDTSVSKGGQSACWIPRISKIKRKQITAMAVIPFLRTHKIQHWNQRTEVS